MSAFDTAKAFFEACESGKGWAGCKQFVADGATFTVQTEAMAEIKTVEEYAETMAGLANQVLPGCSYDVHAAAYDDDSNTAIFFATFHARHTGDGGPVPATNKETHTHYVYALTMDESDKVCKMVKVWNSNWAFAELGWA